MLKFFFKYHYKFLLIKVLLLIIIFNAQNSFSQVNDSIALDDINTEQIIENISEINDGAEIDYSEFIEDLQYYSENPININTATTEDMKKILLLNDYQSYQLKSYIDIKGEIVSIYELNAIDGFDLATIFRILPYITIKPSKSQYNISFKELLKYGRNQIFIRNQQVLEKQKGYDSETDPSSKYLGDKQKLYMRYNYNFRNKIKFGITGEKDAGEQFFKGEQKYGFDFYSAHFFAQDFGFIKTLAIGDYHLQFGQGLALWSGMGSVKSSNSTDLKKRAMGIKPYTSTDENNFFRGIATTLRYKKIDFSIFYSSNRKDASLSDTTSSEELYISSLQETGFHRTVAEIEKKDAVSENIYGAHLTYKLENIKVGATFVKSKYNLNLNKETTFYNQFEFKGIENSNISIDYTWLYKGSSLFGEVARSENGGLAILNGISFNPHPLVGIGIIHRYYENDYQPIRAAAFGENSKNANENGIYLGTSIILNSKLTINAYSDIYKFPWLKYRVDAPSDGQEYLIQATYTPTRRTQMYLRFKQTTKSINYTENIYLNTIEKYTKQSIRFHIDYKLINNLSLKSRVEFSNYKTENSSTSMGYLIYQDLGYSFQKIPLTIHTRYAIFSTDSYDERIYAYENDVLYAFSIPAYYYKGNRFYFLLKYKVMKNIELWFRISQTWYANKNVVSSGLDEIEGNKKTEIKAQIRLKF